MLKLINLVLLPVLFSGYSCSDEMKIPEYVKALDNLTVYPLDAEPAKSIRLIREVSFGDTDDVLIGGIGSTAIDDTGRVFTYDPQQKTIHVFNPDGSYLTSLGREGPGPGEFINAVSLSIVSNHLYAYAPMPLKVNIFSLEPLEFSHSLNLNTILVNQNEIEELSHFSFNLNRIHIRNDGSILGRFRRVPTTIPGQADKDRKNKYYVIDGEGRIVSDKIFGKRACEIIFDLADDMSYATFPFLGVSLMTISKDDRIFSARSEDFLIEVRSREGKYLRAFYHPLAKKAFNRNDAIRNEDIESRIRIIRNARSADLPEFWPVLNFMQIDDENRLWISTIVNDDEIYEWWVLEESGDVITKFERPRNEPIETVKNGYLYTRETDEETGLVEIVRYRIKMEEI